MKTIIQAFPTLYGEALNGSVFGQPNGSIARPPQNVAASIVLAGDTPKLERYAQSGTMSVYRVVGVTATLNIFSAGGIKVKAIDSVDTIFASKGQVYRDGMNVFIQPLQGATADMPTDGSTVTIKVEFIDQDSQIVAADTISATFEDVV